jgi:WW domain-containing oxidoreductase
VDLAGKSFLVTGVTSGLGLETVRALAARGGHVIGAARTAAKAEQALASVGAKGTAVECELAEPGSVRAAVKAVRALGRPLDAIVCNAGIMALPTLQQRHGYELQFFTNHVGHFMLVTGLLDALAPAGRVVVTSSDAHRQAPRGGIELDNLSGETGYGAWRAYGQSKLANILFARELARRFTGSKRTANALHPGVIATNLTRHMSPVLRGIWTAVGPVLLKTPAQGAATQTFLAASPLAAGVTGEYFADCNAARARRDAYDADLAARLWTKTEEIVAALPA